MFQTLTEGVILCIIIGDLHQIIGHCRIDPWVYHSYLLSICITNKYFLSLAVHYDWLYACHLYIHSRRKWTMDLYLYWFINKFTKLLAFGDWLVGIPITLTYSRGNSIDQHWDMASISLQLSFPLGYLDISCH